MAEISHAVTDDTSVGETGAGDPARLFGRIGLADGRPQSGQATEVRRPTNHSNFGSPVDEDGARPVGGGERTGPPRSIASKGDFT